MVQIVLLMEHIPFYSKISIYIVFLKSKHIHMFGRWFSLFGDFHLLIVHLGLNFHRHIERFGRL